MLKLEAYLITSGQVTRTTEFMKKRDAMFQHTNVLRLTIYCLFTFGVLVNAALIFAEFYTPENRTLALTSFVSALIILVIAPTYYIAKTGWLKK